MKVRSYENDDYIGLECEQFKFYYGYESALDEGEWDFTVQDKNRKEIFRVSGKELKGTTIAEKFLYGIGLFLNVWHS